MEQTVGDWRPTDVQVAIVEAAIAETHQERPDGYWRATAEDTLVAAHREEAPAAIPTPREEPPVQSENEASGSVIAFLIFIGLGTWRAVDGEWIAAALLWLVAEQFMSIWSKR